MKTLVVYWSLDGNCKWVAETLANELGADLEEIKTKKPFRQSGKMKYIAGVFQVMRKFKPQIQPIQHPLENYDLIVIGSPIWAGTYVPAIGRFVMQYGELFKGKKTAYYCCHRGGGEANAFVDMDKALAGNKRIGSNSFKEPLAQDPNIGKAEVEAWAKVLRAEV